MSEPRSIRFETATVDRLSRFAARHPGMTQSSAAALLVEEGLRMDEHPGVVFREGPSGRRAVLTSGPDVREVVRALRDVRAAEPTLPADEVLEVVCQVAALALPDVRAAVSYYGAFADEIDAEVVAADRAAEQLERQLSTVRQMLEPHQSVS